MEPRHARCVLRAHTCLAQDNLLAPYVLLDQPQPSMEVPLVPCVKQALMLISLVSLLVTLVSWVRQRRRNKHKLARIVLLVQLLIQQVLKDVLLVLRVNIKT